MIKKYILIVLNWTYSDRAAQIKSVQQIPYKNLLENRNATLSYEN